MKTRSLLFVMVVVPTLILASTYAQERACTNTLIVVGKDNTGNPISITIPLNKKNYDWAPEELPGEIEKENSRYAGAVFSQISPRTKKQDCVGYVFDKLWNIGQYNINFNELDKIINAFGHPVEKKAEGTSLLESYEREKKETYDLKENDIVTWPEHAAIITSYDKITRTATVETKWGWEPVYKHTFNVINPDTADLLFQNGPPSFWRLDFDRIKSVAKMHPTDECYVPCTSGEIFSEPEPGFDIQATDMPNCYTGTDLSCSDSLLCQKQCENDPQCVAYTMLNSGAYGYSGVRCWLCKYWSSLHPNSYGVSGFKCPQA